MRIFNFKNEKIKSFQIANESFCNRYGFKHRSTLFYINDIGDFEIDTNEVQYHNRTWESYQFQTCMSGLIHKILDKKYEEAKEEYKKNNNLKRLSKKAKEELDKSFNAGEDVKMCNLMLSEIRGY